MSTTDQPMSTDQSTEIAPGLYRNALGREMRVLDQRQAEDLLGIYSLGPTAAIARSSDQLSARLYAVDPTSLAECGYERVEEGA